MNQSMNEPVAWPEPNEPDHETDPIGYAATLYDLSDSDKLFAHMRLTVSNTMRSDRWREICGYNHNEAVWLITSALDDLQTRLRKGP